jgi:hypothetical protein
VVVLTLFHRDFSLALTDHATSHFQLCDAVSGCGTIPSRLGRY